MSGNVSLDNFFIYGPPGSGKGTLGRHLAERLTAAFVDLDAEIERDAGRSIPALFADGGEAAFRAREARALQAALAGAAAEGGLVIALGGGALLDPANRKLAGERGKVLCLHAPLEVLLARTGARPESRPLLAADGVEGAPERALAALLERRAAHSAGFARRLDASSDDLDAKTAEAMTLLGAFRVRGMGAPYDVRVGAGLLTRLGSLAAARGWRGAAAVVADSNTAAPYGEAAADALRAGGAAAATVVIPAGEAHKRIETVNDLWRGLLRAGVARDGTVVAVGGGVVGDLAGFAAATWMRGVRWAVAPTSLLAMVDSSLGGKTAFDLPDGKNLVGAFHPPALVLADTAALRSLPREELRCGLAEAVKHGVLGDAALFTQFERLARAGGCTAADLTDELVARSMAVKIRIIESDPFEQGERAALNLGHTVGHAIETAAGFTLRHGEAVAMGLVAEARLAERLGVAGAGLAARLAETLGGLGLPTELPPGIDRRLFMAALRRDKKRRGGAVRFALPAGIGATRLGVAVEEKMVEEIF